jgi:dTDP-4-dehydrorhamnose reductase
MMHRRETILLTGARGQLGRELAVALSPYGRVVAADRSLLDLAQPAAIVRTVRDVAPTIIVNAGAYTAVDRAEDERALAFAVNANAPGILAEEAKRQSAVLVHFSTDYVFDGMQRTPYDENARPNPQNVYGASKLDGERAIVDAGAAALVFRTSWIYGLAGKNFLLTVRRLADERDELRIVADQFGVPNWSRSLAGALSMLIERGAPYLAERAGLYNLSATGETSWCEFARAIVADRADVKVTPIATSDYLTPARRPAYAVLDARKFRRVFGFELPDWRRVLQSCVTSPVEPPSAPAVA